MEPLKSRTRVVYFRMSEEEFTKLCNYREEQGARSVSEVARAAVSAVMQTSSKGGKEEIFGRLDNLERSVSEMNLHLQTLTKALAGQEAGRNL